MAKRDALTELKLAFHCPAKWESMKGDDQVRHCSQCSRNVYNVSGMTREEAIEFLEAHREKVCVRFYRRYDGTILTMPCGRVKRKLFKFKMAAVSALGALGLTFFAMPVYAGARALPAREVFRHASERLAKAREELSTAKDPTEREAWQTQVQIYREELSRAYRRLTPEDIAQLAEEDRKLTS